MIDLEETAINSSYDPLWNTPGAVSEEIQRNCISGLYLSAVETSSSVSVLIFCKTPTIMKDGVSSERVPISGTVCKGDRVHISMEAVEAPVGDIEDIAVNTSFISTHLSRWCISNIQPSLCSGTVTDISTEEVHVTVKILPRRIKSYIGQATSGSFFRLDKDSTSIGVSTLRSNLIKMFVDQFRPNEFQDMKRKAEQKEKANHHIQQVKGGESLASHGPSSSKLSNLSDAWATLPLPGNVKIRSLVVDLRPPTFSSDVNVIGANFMATVYKGCSTSELLNAFTLLNDQQQEAVKRILSARDYVLLLGMPGTGKTSTLALVIRSIVAKGYRVLITSYTHSAVDSLLSKLDAAGMDSPTILRLGSLSSVKESLHKYVLTSDVFGSSKALKERVNAARVVACTVLAASSDSVISNLDFDFCIVDEAGQITQPAAIGALLLSKRFVLVGDDYQLPPLILSDEAQNGGMDVSLFKRLAEAHPQAVVTLSEQYRMNAEIMEISNILIYDNRLRCGSHLIATGRLNLTISTLSSDEWLHACVDPNRPVVFLNTDRLQNVDNKFTLESYRTGNVGRKKDVVNLHEVQIVSKIHTAFLENGMKMENIGFVSPYRSQVSTIKESLDMKNDNLLTSGGTSEVSTVDKFQGRDMEVMVLSMVRSNSFGNVGDLLRDWRRVNVAITRAKFKLVIIGSLEIMEHIPVLKSLRDIVVEKGYIVHIP